MKFAVVLFACFVAVQSFYRIQRPNYDCDKWCQGRTQKNICSKSNNTHVNDCYLDCFWEDKDCDGACPCTIQVKRVTYCTCPKEKKPVCCYGGETRDNRCVAECEQKHILHDGPCYDSFF